MISYMHPMPSDKYDVFSLRLATTDDFDNLLTFYADNHHPGIERRHKALYWECVLTNCVHLIVDDRGDICGSSITFNYPTVGYAEVGATRIIRPFGFPLYEHLLAAQALDMFFFNPSRMCPIANVNVSNRSVINRLSNNLGWEEFDAPTEVTLVNEALILQRDEAVRWFACPIKALGQYATWLSSLSARPVIQNIRGSRVLLACNSLRVIIEYGNLLTFLPAFTDSYDQNRRFMWAAARQAMLESVK